MKVFGFDYDGTIINIEPQKAQVFGNISQKKWGVNFNEAAKYYIEGGGVSRKDKFGFIYREKFGREFDKKEYEEAEGEFSRTLRDDYYPKVELLPGALDLLQFVRKNFDFVFVSSGVPMEEIKYLVELNGVSKYFDLILGTNEKYPSKRDHFSEIIETKNPKLFIYLADGLYDMKIAKEFDIVSIGVPTNQSEEALLSVGADYVSDLSECGLLIKNKILF